MDVLIRSYQNELIGMFEFEDGKVKRFTEYFNPLQFLKAIKPQDPPLQQELADRSAIEEPLIRYSYSVDFRDWKSPKPVCRSKLFI